MSFLTYDDLFFANDVEYLDDRPGAVFALIRRGKEYKPDCCVCCFMFNWMVGEDRKTICGGRCAAKPEIGKEKFIEKGKALEAAHERRVEGCPLEDDSDEQ